MPGGAGGAEQHLLALLLQTELPRVQMEGSAGGENFGPNANGNPLEIDENRSVLDIYLGWSES